MNTRIRLLFLLALAPLVAVAQVSIPGRVVALTPSLSSIGNLTPAANKFPYYTGASTAALGDVTAFAFTLLDDANASSARTTLGAYGSGDNIAIGAGTGISLVLSGALTHDGGYSYSLAAGPFSGAPDYMVGLSTTTFQRYNATGIRSFLGLATTDSPTFAGGTFTGSITSPNNQSSANYIGTLGTVVIAGSATGTLHTFANTASNGMFLVTVRQDGSAANFASAMVSTYGANAAVFRVGQDNTNQVLTLDFTVSGLSLQLTPGSGYGSTTWRTSITPITQ